MSCWRRPMWRKGEKADADRRSWKRIAIAAGRMSPALKKLARRWNRKPGRRSRRRVHLTQAELYLSRRRGTCIASLGDLLLESRRRERRDSRISKPCWHLNRPIRRSRIIDLAKALAAPRSESTKRKIEVLLALEAAPDFKPAQQLLLKLNK